MSAITQAQKDACVANCQKVIQALNAYGLNPTWAGTGPLGGALASGTEKTAIQTAYAAIKTVMDTWTT